MQVIIHAVLYIQYICIYLYYSYIYIRIYMHIHCQYILPRTWPVTPPPYSMVVTLVITLADRVDVLGTILLQFSIQLLSFWIILRTSFSSNKTNVFCVLGIMQVSCLTILADSRWCFWAPWHPFAPPCSHEPCLKCIWYITFMSK